MLKHNYTHLYSYRIENGDTDDEDDLDIEDMKYDDGVDCDTHWSKTAAPDTSTATATALVI